MGALREPWIFLVAAALLTWRFFSGGRPMPIFAVGLFLGSLGFTLKTNRAFRDDGDGLDVILPVFVGAMLLALTAILYGVHQSGGLKVLGPWARRWRGLTIHGLALGAGLEVGREIVRAVTG